MIGRLNEAANRRTVNLEPNEIAAMPPVTPTSSTLPATPGRPRGPRNFRGRGMTLAETLLAMLVLAALLGSMVLVSARLREDDAGAESRQVLRTLRQALQAYHQAHETWPAGPTHQALEALLQQPDSARALEALAPTLDDRGRWVIRDGYGKPVHYLAVDPDSYTQPDFVSAGPDGRLGDLAAGTTTARPDRAGTDNLYGAELESPAR